MADALPCGIFLHHIHGRTFHYVQKTDLVALFVRSNRFIQGNFPGMLFPGAEHHQQFIVDASGCIGGKPGGFTWVKGGNCLHQADGADGDQVVKLHICSLIFFYYMGNKPQITLNENGFCFHIAPLVLLKIVLLLGHCQRFQKSLQIATSKGISI